jgi:Zn-dependent membrane protease YugP
LAEMETCESDAWELRLVSNISFIIFIPGFLWKTLVIRLGYVFRRVGGINFSLSFLFQFTFSL